MPAAASTDPENTYELAFEITGLIGSFLLSTSMFCQLYKVIRTKRASDISYSWLFLFLIGIACVVIYGFGLGLWPIYIPTTLEFIGSLLILIFKFYYDSNDDCRDIKSTSEL